VRVPQVREVEREGSLVVVVRHLAVAAWDGASPTVVDFGGLDRDDDRPYAVVDTRAAGAIYHNNRGAQALRDGDVETALVRLESAVHLAPDWPEARVNLGVALRRAGDPRGAYDAYRDALRLDPGNPSALANLAVLYGAQERPEEQAEALRSLSGSRVTVYALLALAQVEMAAGNLRAARHALRRAWWRDPGLPEVHEALATWHLRSGHLRTARRHERQAVRAWNREAAPRSGSDPNGMRPPPSPPPAP
jgi:Flp pilus assembly protein TadD